MKFARARTEKRRRSADRWIQRLTDRLRSIIAGCTGAIRSPLMAAIVTDELQPVEIAVIAAAIRAFEFHGRKN